MTNNEVHPGKMRVHRPLWLGSVFLLLLAASCQAPATAVWNIPPVPRSGLVAEWLFNGTLNDTAGTNNGTATNVGTGTSSFGTGKRGLANEALYLSSPDLSSNYSYVSFAPSSLTNIAANQPLSISLWFNASSTSLAGPCLILENFGLTNPELNFSFQLSGGILTANIGKSGVGAVSAATPGTVTANVWHHAVLVYDGTSYQLSLYLDGSLQSQVTNTYTTATAAATGYVIIGLSGNTYSGSLERIRVYNRTLSSSEITGLEYE